jgi:phage recombination protein Bet
MSDSKDIVVSSSQVLDFSRGFSGEQMQLLRDTICPRDASEAEIRMFAYQCLRRKLDPFIKQIYAIKRWDSERGKEVLGFQTGIDGFRVTAERTGKYRGQVGPEWCGPDGVWKSVWVEEAFPTAARVGVLKEGCSGPIWGVALWKEYAQLTKQGQPTRMWRTMPANQLAKCAESLALRKAFPEDLGGIYTKEEMEQSERVDGEDKAASIQQNLERPPASGPSTLQVQPAPEPKTPETGDALADWVVPAVIKPIAGERLGTIPVDRLKKAIAWGKGWFEAEHKEPRGSWAEFFDKAQQLLDRKATEDILEAEFTEVPEPGSSG